jgi:hypothetical protein
MVSDFDLLKGPERFDAEFDLVEQLARAAGRPLSMTWLQRDPGGAAVAGDPRAGRPRRRRRLAALPAGRGARHRRDRRPRGELPSVHGLSVVQGDRRAAARRARRGDARAGAQGAVLAEKSDRSPATAPRSRRWSTSCWRGSS